jgi:organic radical activating enzyme
MTLLKAIVQEIESYPQNCFIKNFQPSALSLEITKQCTNFCQHCSNYGSPQEKTFLDFPLIQTLITQATERRYKHVFLWGGEPFLHKNFLDILKYVLQHNLSLTINTNAFWADSLQAVREFIACIQPFISNGLTLRLGISCDKFHQSQKATPLQHVVNIITVLESDYAGFDYMVQSVSSPADDTFQRVLALLQKQRPEISITTVQKKQYYIPILYSAGRAKTLSQQGDYLDPYNGPISCLLPFAAYLPQELFITVSGQVVLLENWVGDEILSLGNIKECSLVKIEAALNNSKLLKLLFFQPVKYFLYPFRKYLELQDLVASVQKGKVKNQWFLKNIVASLLQTREKEFDFSCELQEARRIYSTVLPMDFVLLALDTIECYGDFSDIAALCHLLVITTENLVREKIQNLLAGTYCC